MKRCIVLLWIVLGTSAVAWGAISITPPEPTSADEVQVTVSYMMQYNFNMSVSCSIRGNTIVLIVSWSRPVIHPGAWALTDYGTYRHTESLGCLAEGTYLVQVVNSGGQPQHESVRFTVSAPAASPPDLPWQSPYRPWVVPTVAYVKVMPVMRTSLDDVTITVGAIEGSFHTLESAVQAETENNEVRLSIRWYYNHICYIVPVGYCPPVGSPDGTISMETFTCSRSLGTLEPGKYTLHVRNYYVDEGTPSDGVTLSTATRAFTVSSGAAADGGDTGDGGADGALVGVYRFWSPAKQRHFYTADEAEKDKLISTYSRAWTYEGLAFQALADGSDPGSLPVYRFWSDALGAHFYTISEIEKDTFVNGYSDAWTFETIAFYAYPEGIQPAEARPVHRFWSDTLGCHFYTISDSEADKLIADHAATWTYEGVAWYAFE